MLATSTESENEVPVEPSTPGRGDSGDEGAWDTEFLEDRHPTVWDRVRYRSRRWYAGVFPPLVRTKERLWDELKIASEDLWPIQEAIRDVENQTDGKVHPAFKRARWAIEQGDVESFWRNLYLIREWELRAILVLESHPDLHTENIEIPTLEQKARSVLREARDRFEPRELAPVEAELVDGAGNLRTDLGIDDVLAAIEVIYDRYRREFSEGVVVRMLEIQVLTFIGATFAAMVLILGTVVLVPGVFEAAPTDPTFLLFVVWFGILGASVSGLFTLSDALKGAEVPKSVGHFSLTIGRLVVGAAGALILHVFLLSGVLSLVFNVSSTNPTSALVVAFIGGFSERLLRRAVERVVGTEEAALAAESREEESETVEERPPTAAPTPDGGTEESA